MKILKKIIKIFLVIMFLFLLIKVGIMIYVNTSSIPSIKTANNYYLYDKDDNLIFQGSDSGEWTNIKNISEHLINATISIEDKNFYKHSGFDYLRIMKAMFENVKEKKIVQGASTITQQYAKNLFLEFDKSWKRKWDEMWITIKIEHNYEKDEILEGYLNTINYGHGIYGIENASNFYFNKDASDLSLAESSILAGIPNSPANYSPITNYELSKERQRQVLNHMVINGYITQEESDKAYNQNLEFYGKKKDYNLTTLSYYQDAVMQELKSINSIPKTYLETGGLRIYTSLDLEAQTILEESINKYITNKKIQTAGVMIDPNTGGVLALIGGKDYSKSQFNRAINSKRQPGSTIKSLLYYSALENSFTSSTTFLSQETSFNFTDGVSYSPQNYNQIYADKAISLAAAIAYSDNIYAVKTHLFLGEESLVNIAKRLGIKSELKPVASLPLGSVEVNLLEMVSSYSVFASLGYKNESHFIRKVYDNSGHLLYENKNEPELILNKSTTFILNELLTGTYDSNLSDYTYPSCLSMANKLTNKYSIKSGTTDTDVWLIGYNKNAVLGLWSGYDDNKNVTSNDSTNNKNVWAKTMEQYLKNKDNSWYDIPDNVVGILVDPITGKPATNDSKHKKVLYYLKGTEPSETDMVFDEILNN